MSDCPSMDSRVAGLPAQAAERLPVANLLALATAAFITILTEALPAGLLPLMSADLRVPEALIGQLVTVYALGSIVAAIPLVAATRAMRRRHLLLAALAGFVVSNALTAVSPYYALTLVARFVAGMAAGLLWALLAGYASRMVDASLRGRAIAVAMLGAPVAMSVGIPAGTALGAALGWRVAFALITLAALALIGWIRLRVPDYAGQPAGAREPVLGVMMLPGVRPVLTVMFAYVLAHNMLYTYVAPFLAGVRMGTQVDVVLFVFGLASLAGIALTGAWIGAAQRRLTLASIALFALAALMLGAGSGMAIVYAGVALWGLAFGGAPTLFQTAAANAAGESADVAQSMLVTVWNLAIAGGGIAGGMLLGATGAGAIPWVLVAQQVAAESIPQPAPPKPVPRVKPKVEPKPVQKAAKPTPQPVA
ncbi:MFS transporter, partial [Burkholderia sp. Tr-20355]|uniref:MFS transporter n=1 Tax=Burkholderia sp. Tr-20355 TaxID=2703895 RepID=UPI001F11AACF